MEKKTLILSTKQWLRKVRIELPILSPNKLRESTTMVKSKGIIMIRCNSQLDDISQSKPIHIQLPVPILEHQEFQYSEETPVNRVNLKYKGLLSSKDSSIKSIKKVTPKRSSLYDQKVSIQLTFYSHASQTNRSWRSAGIKIQNQETQPITTQQWSNTTKFTQSSFTITLGKRAMDFIKQSPRQGASAPQK